MTNNHIIKCFYTNINDKTTSVCIHHNLIYFAGSRYKVGVPADIESVY